MGTATPPRPGQALAFESSRRYAMIALLAAMGIAIYLVLRCSVPRSTGWTGIAAHDLPLQIALVLGGLPLVAELLWKAVHAEFGSDLLAGISIVTSVVLGEYLAGTLVVLMLSGGQTLEAYA